MKKIIIAALSLTFMVGLSGLAVAGSLDSPGAPSAGSGMYTLQNLYDYLTSGSALTAQSSFQEPTSGPGSTMKTTKEIGDAIKALLDQSDVGTDNVESGKRFFCTQAGSWGIQTGTLIALPRPTATPTITPTPTITATATPTPWGSAACAAKGGLWAETQLTAPDDYGCWFFATAEGSCTDVCSLVSLQCDPAKWDDSPSCTLCRNHWPSPVGTCGATTQLFSPWNNRADGNCHTGPKTNVCGETTGYSTGRRLCVCKP
ncbi:MAG: hypothetical protein NTZ78_04150 [Candidatus Aureabacteria bacterium]|nr:hypothetical protein [Candidatus Auribacterota bacterium]